MGNKPFYNPSQNFSIQGTCNLKRIRSCGKCMPNLGINHVCFSVEVNLAQRYDFSHKMGHLKPRSIHINADSMLRTKFCEKYLRGIALTHHVLQVWIQFTQWMFTWSPTVSKKIITTVIRFLLFTSLFSFYF